MTDPATILENLDAAEREFGPLDPGRRRRFMAAFQVYVDCWERIQRLLANGVTVPRWSAHEFEVLKRGDVA